MAMRLISARLADAFSRSLHRRAAPSATRARVFRDVYHSPYRSASSASHSHSPSPKHGMQEATTTTATTTSSSSTSPDAVTEEQTHFGFSSVPLSVKPALVDGVFERVASRYDVMNDAMSFTVHRAWKRALVSSLSPTAEMRILDCAGGTGDVAFRILRARSESIKTSTHSSRQANEPVIVCDVNKEMLSVGRQKARRMGYTNDDVRFLQGNAENLPLPDQSIDAYVISFGMRNVARPGVALAEALRVLRPGGRFLMLEFAEVDNPLLRTVYDAYSFNVIPTLGALIAGDRQSYQYLVESIRQFPKQEQFAQLMRQTGFRHVSVTDYSFGVVAEYSGFKAVSHIGTSAPSSDVQQTYELRPDDSG